MGKISQEVFTGQGDSHSSGTCRREGFRWKEQPVPRPRGGVVKGCVGSSGEESWLERLMRFNNGVFESQLKEFLFATMQTGRT